MEIFVKNTMYAAEEIFDLCSKNNLTTVDCLKEESMISIEEFIDGELGGECLFEFDRIKCGYFKLSWSKSTSKTC
jgi:hypothetical protein